MAARRLRALVQHTHLQAVAVSPSSSADAAAFSDTDQRDSSGYAEFSMQPIDVDASRLAEVAGGNPLSRLAAGEVPAIILRNTLPAEVCMQVMQRFHEAGQFPPSFLPFLDIDSTASDAPPAGMFGIDPLISSRERGGGGALPGHKDILAESVASRSDIGYSLGTGGNDPTTYWDKCAVVQDMFDEVLAPFPKERNPMHLMYDALEALGARSKRVATAYEERGSYGPAIIRTHKPDNDSGTGHTYIPHYDSVRRREVRDGFEVFKFDTQLAGILVLQAPDRVAQPGAETGNIYHDSILYNIPAADLPKLKLTQRAALSDRQFDDTGTASGNDVHAPAFREFCMQNKVASATVDLNVGDMCVVVYTASPRPRARFSSVPADCLSPLILVTCMLLCPSECVQVFFQDG